MSSTKELDAEVLRAIEYVNHAIGTNIPTDPKVIALIRASLHGGDYMIVQRRGAVERTIAQVDEYIAMFPSRNRTSLYQGALALRERLAQIAESESA